MKTPLLEIEELSVGVHTARRVVPVVHDVSLAIPANHTVALVGESGSGKSLTGLAIMRLLHRVGALHLGGRITLDGQDLLAGDDGEARRWRGARIALVPQEPMSALDPVFTIGTQLTETLTAHRLCSRKEATTRAAQALAAVRIPHPVARLRDYPHSLSGGMRQRVLIAMALMMRPAVLIADEPTTSLDVTVQAQVLRLIQNLAQENGMSVLLITHDMGVAAMMADTIVVMYAGRIVESGPARKILGAPAHPYTAALLSCVPRTTTEIPKRLPTVRGQIPSVGQRVSGCPFHPRCSDATVKCHESRPSLATESGRQLACWHPRTPGLVP